MRKKGPDPAVWESYWLEHHMFFFSGFNEFLTVNLLILEINMFFIRLDSKAQKITIEKCYMLAFYWKIINSFNLPISSVNQNLKFWKIWLYHYNPRLVYLLLHFWRPFLWVQGGLFRIFGLYVGLVIKRSL